MITTIMEVILIFLTSMVKFTLSPLLSLSLGYGLWQTMLITSIGGCAGVVVFYLTSGGIMEWLEGRARESEIQRGHRRKCFTRTNKTIVKVKRNQGLNGLAAITPIIISIPIGTIIAAKYFRNDRRTLPVLLSSVLIWDVILSNVWNLIQ